MKNLWLVAFLFVGLSFVTSCKDDDDVHDHNSDTELEYQIEIMSPDAADKKVGDDIHLHVNFNEKNAKTIHHINIKIYQKDDPFNIIYDQPGEAHIHQTDGVFEYHDDFSLESIPPHKNWILEAKVWAQEAGKNETVSTIEFHVHPQ